MVNIIFMGTPDFAVPALQNLISSNSNSDSFLVYFIAGVVVCYNTKTKKQTQTRPYIPTHKH